MSKKKEPRSAALACWDKQKRILVAKRKDTKHYKGYYGFPGGKMEKNELPVAAVAREMAEETGVAIPYSYMTVAHCISNQVDPKSEMCFVFETDLWQFEIDRISNKEGSKNHEWEWLTVEELLKKKLMPGIAEYIEEAVKRRDSKQ